ncbi:MAG: metallophosphoesterase [Clostridia bacterium]|nr:metallophosphoesterase [Clostridia bacterium]
MIKKVLISTAVAGFTFAALGFNNKLKLTRYIVESPKVKRPFNMVFLSDIHSIKFKDGGRNLFETIDKAMPDCILLGGDVFHKFGDEEDFERTYELLKNLACKYQNCCMITGNHEFECGKADEIRRSVAKFGINILGDESYVLSAANDQSILVGGTDYAGFGEDEVLLQKQNFVRRAEESGLFSVLVRHIPMRVENDENIDLILSGHNHGGLWRLPKTKIGVAGGGGKLFPKYTHGKYNFNNSCLIVGSGITTETYLLPRLYNPPEVVSVSVVPKI